MAVDPNRGHATARYADVEFGRLQARDLLQHLWTGAISNSPVDIVQGSKSVEVRPVGISKVRPAVWGSGISGLALNPTSCRAASRRRSAQTASARCAPRAGAQGSVV